MNARLKQADVLPNVLDEALRLAAEGFHVFPLIPEGSKLKGSKIATGKEPALAFTTKATNDPETLREWFEPGGRYVGYGLALRTGTTRKNPETGAREWLVVVDVDMSGHGKDGLSSLKAACSDAGISLDDCRTRVQETPGSGWHALYWSPVQLRAGVDVLGPQSGVDIKAGTGAYIAVAPTAIDGKRYRWEDPAAPIASMGNLADLFPQGNPEPKAADRAPLPGIDPERARARAIDYLKTAERSIKGAGGDLCAYRVAAKLKDLGVDEAEALDLMLSEHWDEGCGWKPERLAEKVRNAYNYGANPPGADAPEAQFQPVPEEETAPANAKVRENPFKPLRLADLRKLPRPEWTVADLIPATGMGIIYGPSGSGKTFLTLDIGGACVRGVHWAGREVKQGVVVYVGLEGQARTRVEAYAKTHGLADSDLADLVIFEQPPLNLLDVGERAASTAQLIAAVKGAAACDVRLTIIDTLAQATPGGDENSSVMMSAVIDNAKRIRHALGGTVLLVHHTGKDQNAGARGHSSLMAASDFALAVTRSESGSTRQVKVSKVKDAEDGAQWTFQLDRVTLETEPKLITSCVVAGLEPGQLVTAAPAKGRNLTPLQTNVLMALQHAITAEDAGGAIDWDGTRTASKKAWRASYYLRTPVDPEEKDNRRKSFDKAVQLLTAGSAVEIVTTGGTTAYRPVAAF